jgi:hypothetical protein
MKKTLVVLILVILAAAVGYYAFQAGRSQERIARPSESDRQDMPPRQPVSEIAEESEPRYPVPDVSSAAKPEPAIVPEPAEEALEEPPPAKIPLPSLTESDAAVAESLARFVPEQSLDRFFYANNIIKRMAVTVDTLPQQKLPPRLLPVKPAPRAFRVEMRDGTPVISPRNYERYEPYIQMIEAIDIGKATSFYVRHYPLFQKAYRLLGQTGYFNDRVVEVINHLLAAPETEGPIRLEPHVNRYKYADPGLEALSAGQKIMIRIGSENASIVKDWLLQIRRAITTLPARQP